MYHNDITNIVILYYNSINTYILNSISNHKYDLIGRAAPNVPLP